MISYNEDAVANMENIYDSIVCDRCGREISLKENFLKIRHELSKINGNEGFIEADICDDCLLEMLQSVNVKYRLYLPKGKK